MIGKIKKALMASLIVVTLISLTYAFGYNRGGIDFTDEEIVINEESPLLDDPKFRKKMVDSWKYESIDWELHNKMHEAIRRFDSNLPMLERKYGVKYGGSFVNAEMGIIYIGLVNPTHEQKKAILEVMNPDPRIKVVFYRAKFTLKELEEAKWKVIENWSLIEEESGAKITLIDAEEVRNILYIWLGGPKESREKAKKLILQLVKVDVDFDESDEPRYFKANSKLKTFRPVIGGVKMETACKSGTIGFSAKRDTILGVFVSGHAEDVNTAVYQPNMTAAFL